MAILSISLSAGLGRSWDLLLKRDPAQEKITSKLLLLGGSRSPEVWYADRAIAKLQ